MVSSLPPISFQPERTAFCIWPTDAAYNHIPDNPGKSFTTWKMLKATNPILVFY